MIKLKVSNFSRSLIMKRKTIILKIIVYLNLAIIDIFSTDGVRAAGWSLFCIQTQLPYDRICWACDTQSAGSTLEPSKKRKFLTSFSAKGFVRDTPIQNSLFIFSSAFYFKNKLISHNNNNDVYN